MLLRSIYLYNFRTFLDQDFEFQDGNNLIIAFNGKGKSNLIEAINFFSTTRSFKTNINKEVIAFDKTEASLVANIDKDNQSNKMNIVFKVDGTKKIKINNNLLSKASDLLREFTTVLVSPNDNSIIDGSPNIRRKYLDTILFKCSSKYINQLKDYKKIIDIKRKMLKDNKTDKNLLKIYNEKQEIINIVIERERICLLKSLEKTINLFINQFYPKLGYIKFIYKNTFQDFDINKEQQYRDCLYGSHRDDFSIELNNVSVKKYCSTGEKRLISLILKISENEYYKDTKKIKPVLLLDDAFLGIDDERQSVFYKLIDNNQQKILTATDDKHLSLLKDSSVIRL